MERELFLSQDARRAAEAVTTLGALAREHGWPMAVLVCVSEADTVVFCGETNIAPEMYPILSAHPQAGAGLFHAACMIAGGIAGELPGELVEVMLAGPPSDATTGAQEAPATVGTAQPGAASEGVASPSEEQAPATAPANPTAPEGAEV